MFEPSTQKNQLEISVFIFLVVIFEIFIRTKYPKKIFQRCQKKGTKTFVPSNL